MATVVTGVAVSELPPHPETTNRNVSATAYFLTVSVCHPSPGGGVGDVRSPRCRYAPASSQTTSSELRPRCDAGRSSAASQPRPTRERLDRHRQSSCHRHIRKQISQRLTRLRNSRRHTPSLPQRHNNPQTERFRPPSAVRFPINRACADKVRRTSVRSEPSRNRRKGTTQGPTGEQLASISSTTNDQNQTNALVRVVDRTGLEPVTSRV